MNGKDVIRRLFSEVLNGDDRDVLDDLIGDDYVDHSPVPEQLPGSEGVKLKLKGLREAFPDIRFNLEMMISEGDTVAVRYHWSATHEGDFGGIPATGKHVDVGGMDFYRIEDGRIAEHWDSVDQFALMQQLGAL